MSEAAREPRRSPAHLEILRHADGAVGIVSLAAALLGLACGRGALGVNARPDGGAPESQTAALCGVSTTMKPPFNVEFVFHAAGPGQIYLRQSCGSYGFSVSSCASGYAKPLGPVSAVGLCECSMPNCSPPVGGPCAPDEGIALLESPGVSLPWPAWGTELDWTGVNQCSRSAVLPAGKYRVSLSAYDNAEDARRGVNGWVVTHDFELPAPGGIVDVPIGARAAESCESATGATAKACTGKEGRETACDLPGIVGFSWEGGELAPYYDRSSIAPPAAYSIDRTSNTGTPADPARCDAVIPRCARDARVVTTSDLTRVLAEPSVAAAFSTTRTTFGNPGSFGQTLVIRRSDGKELGISSACTAGLPDCPHPVTAALAAVVDVFSRLWSQRVAESCPAFGYFQ